MKHLLRLAAVVSTLSGGAAWGASILLSEWDGAPLTVGDLTFTYVSSTGFSLSEVRVEATGGPGYALTFSALNGHISGTELRYEVQVTSGSQIFGTVGLQVQHVTSPTAVTTSWFSGYFHTDAALPQTIGNSGSVSGVVVDGDQTHLYVVLDPDLSEGGALDSVVHDYALRAAVPEPATLAVWGGLIAGGTGVWLRRRSGRRS